MLDFLLSFYVLNSPISDVTDTNIYRAAIEPWPKDKILRLANQKSSLEQWTG